MEYSAQQKEIMIRECISSVPFHSGDFSIKETKKIMKRLLHEEPDIEIEWKRDNIIVEREGRSIKKANDKVISVTVAFSNGVDAQNNPVVHKVKYYIDYNN